MLDIIYGKDGSVVGNSSGRDNLFRVNTNATTGNVNMLQIIMHLSKPTYNCKWNNSYNFKYWEIGYTMSTLSVNEITSQTGNNITVPSGKTLIMTGHIIQSS